MRPPSMSGSDEQVGGVLGLHGAAVVESDRLGDARRASRQRGARIPAWAAWAIAGVAVRPVPMAQTGS